MEGTEKKVTESKDINKVKRKQNEFQEIAPPRYSIWKHYKGELYIVHDFVMRESDQEMMICYFGINSKLPYSWSRPFSEWNQVLKHNGEFVKRFTMIGGI